MIKILNKPGTGNLSVYQEVKVAQLCLTLQPHGLYSPGNSPGQNTGVGSLSLLQGIFPSQGSNPGLLHCRQILYHLRLSRREDIKIKRGTKINEMEKEKQKIN